MSKNMVLSVLRSSIIACATILSLAEGRAADGHRIGVLLKDRQGQFWSFVEKGATEAAQKSDATLIVKAPPTVYNVGTQFQLLESLRQQGINALVIAPLSPEAISEPVAKLAASGIKIVSLDSPLRADIPHCMVTVNQSAMGEAIANLALSISGDGDEIALFRNNSIDRSVIEREKVMIEKLGRGHTNRVLRSDIYAASELGSEDQQAHLLLQRYPHAKVIVATASSPTLAMLRALRSTAGEKPKLVGFGVYLPADIVTALQDGTLGGFVAQEPKDIGAAGVDTAIALLNGKTLPAVVETSFQVVTKDKLDTPETKALLNP